MLDQGLTDQAIDWIMENAPEAAVGHSLWVIAADVTRSLDFTPGVQVRVLHPRLATPQGRFPITIPKIVFGERATVLHSRIRLPAGGRFGEGKGIIWWEGFAEVRDDCGRHYLLERETKRDISDFPPYRRVEHVTQRLFPAVSDKATRLHLVSPGYVCSRLSMSTGGQMTKESLTDIRDPVAVTIPLR